MSVTKNNKIISHYVENIEESIDIRDSNEIFY